MEKFVSFVADNYIWFLVVTIFLIFALIGYLCDTKKNKNNINNNDYLNADPINTNVMAEGATLNTVINNNNEINNNNQNN